MRFLIGVRASKLRAVETLTRKLPGYESSRSVSRPDPRAGGLSGLLLRSQWNSCRMMLFKAPSRDGRPAVALLSIAGLHYALPSELTVGPDWLLLVLVAVLAVPAMVSHRRGYWRLSHVFGHAATAIVTLSVAIFPRFAHIAPPRA